MALTHFAFVQVGVGYGTGNIPVPVAKTVTSEGITPTTSNQQTAALPSGIASPMCRVSTDTAVYVAFGSNPNALTSTTARYFIPANGVEYFHLNPGDKAAVVRV